MDAATNTSRPALTFHFDGFAYDDRAIHFGQETADYWLCCEAMDAGMSIKGWLQFRRAANGMKRLTRAQKRIIWENIMNDGGSQAWKLRALHCQGLTISSRLAFGDDMKPGLSDWRKTRRPELRAAALAA